MHRLSGGGADDSNNAQSRRDGDEAETSDLNGGRALVAAVLAGAGFWALLVGVTLTLWT